MDYIREEWHRQRAALAVLLMGRTETETQRERGANGTAEMPGADAWKAAWGEERWAVSRSADWPPGPTAAWTALAGAGAMPPVGGPRPRPGGEGTAWTAGLVSLDGGGVGPGAATPAETAARGRRRLQELAAHGPANRTMETWDTPPEAVRLVTEVSRPREAGLRPEEISRAIQRDARRYDGGFSLY